MPAPRIAFATPNLDGWSETFIAAHLQRLPGVVLVLSDGKPPRLADGRSLLLPGSLSDRVRAHWETKVLRLGREVRLHRSRVRAMRARGIQVLFAEYGPTAASLVAASREAGVPLVAHFHGYDAHVPRIAQEWGGYRELFGQASALIAVSRSMVERLVALGAPPDKVHFIPYGVDVTHFMPRDPATAPPHFLGVGRFVDKKAPYLTLLAFREVAAHCAEARLTLAGDGPLREACMHLVQALGLADRVDLPGIKPPEWVSAAMQASRAFVQHSITTITGDSEGTPLAVLEAMASGVPVVATRHAGINDTVVHGESGLLCDELDVKAMAANMLLLAKDPDAARRMGQAGRQYVERHHRVEEQVARLHQVLAQVAVSAKEQDKAPAAP